MNYRKALALYFAATGTYLDAKGVVVGDPGAPDSVHDYWKDVEWLKFSDRKSARGKVDYPAEAVTAE